MRKEFGIQTALVESSGGVYKVWFGQKQIWSKHEAGRFPEEPEILSMIRELTAGTAS